MEPLTLVDLPFELMAAVAVALGLTFGSFLNVFIHRWPRGESVVHPGSHCPHCGRPIAGYHNLPVVGWLVLRGKGACCGQPISPRYPLVEALGGLMGWAVLDVLVLARLPPETEWWRALLAFAAYLALGLGLLAVAFIDLDTMLVPDEVTLGGAALGLASVPLRPGATFLDSALGAAFGFALIWVPFIWLHRLARGQPGMGHGDAKLTLLAGAWFGWQGAVFCLLAGAVQGTVAALATLAARGRIDEPEAVRRERAELHEALASASPEERATLEQALRDDPLAREPEPGLGMARLPFGPFLVLAALEYLFFGDALVQLALGPLG